MWSENIKLKIIIGLLITFLFNLYSFAENSLSDHKNIFNTSSKTHFKTDLWFEQDSIACYSFNGIDSYIEMESQLNQSFSFCAWIKPQDLLKKNMTIVGIPDAFWFRTTVKRELQFTQPGIIDNDTQQLSLTNENWLFVSFVINYPKVKIYVNAKLIGEYKWQGESISSKNKIFIGKNKWQEFYSGSMHHITVSKHALNQVEITKLYRKTKFKPDLKSGIVMYHALDDKNSYYAETERHSNINVQYINDSIRGKVASFSGTNSYIDFGNFPIDNAITISAWIKPETFNRNKGALISLGHAYAFRISSSGSLLFTIPQIADISDPKNPLSINKWQHLAVTFKESKGVTFYINGEKKSFIPEKQYQIANKELKIGTNLWNDFFKGQMDDIIIWNRILLPDEIKAAYNRKSEYWQVFLSNENRVVQYIAILLILIFLSLLIFYLKTQQSKTAITFSKSDAFKEKVNLIIEQHLSDSNFTVNQFAKAMNMSKTKLYNELKQTFGHSPKELIREVRLQKAVLLLNDTSITITEVIYQTGFESRAYFNKCFKDKYKKTPTEYRKKSIPYS